MNAQLYGYLVAPRVTGRNCRFLIAYYASGTLHTWYLFNSHSGRTKKLLLVDETETPCSGPFPESRTLRRRDWRLSLLSASLQRSVFPGPPLRASAAPGRLRRAQVTPAGIGAASGRRETYDEDWLQTELRRRSSQPRDQLGSDEGVRLLRVIVQVTLAVYCVDRAHRVPWRRFPPVQVTPQ